jgi:hypothetical protein
VVVASRATPGGVVGGSVVVQVDVITDQAGEAADDEVRLVVVTAEAQGRHHVGRDQGEGGLRQHEEAAGGNHAAVEGDRGLDGAILLRRQLEIVVADDHVGEAIQAGSGGARDLGVDLQVDTGLLNPDLVDGLGQCRGGEQARGDGGERGAHVCGALDKHLPSPFRSAESFSRPQKGAGRVCRSLTPKFSGTNRSCPVRAIRRDV